MDSDFEKIEYSKYKAEIVLLGLWRRLKLRKRQMEIKNSVSRMDSIAQTEYIKAMKLGIQCAYHSPNKIFYLYRKNMLEPSLRQKYCSASEYCVWCEIYDEQTLSIIDLKVYTISENQIADWTSMLSKFN